MSLLEASGWLALVSGALAYVLPLILWKRMRPNLPTEVLIVPAVMLTSWLTAEYFGIGPPRIGFTFLGAIVVAVVSNVVVLVLARVRGHLWRHRLFWSVGILALSIVVGLGLRVLVPSLPD